MPEREARQPSRSWLKALVDLDQVQAAASGPQSCCGFLKHFPAPRRGGRWGRRACSPQRMHCIQLLLQPVPNLIRGEQAPPQRSVTERLLPCVGGLAFRSALCPLTRSAQAPHTVLLARPPGGNAARASPAGPGAALPQSEPSQGFSSGSLAPQTCFPALDIAPA